MISLTTLSHCVLAVQGTQSSERPKVITIHPHSLDEAESSITSSAGADEPTPPSSTLDLEWILARLNPDEPEEPYLGQYSEDLGYTPEMAHLYSSRLAYISAILSRAAFRRLQRYRDQHNCPPFPQDFTRMTQLPKLTHILYECTPEQDQLLDTFEACFSREERGDLFLIMQWLRWDPTIEDSEEVQHPHAYISQDAIKRSMFGHETFNESYPDACEPFLKDQLITDDGSIVPEECRRIPEIFNRDRDMEWLKPVIPLVS